MNSDPLIDARTAEDIVRQARALRRVYTPEWTADSGDSGSALISIFARLMEIVISRLNRTPEKNFLAFLDTAGIHLLPPRAARVPVRFVASSGAKKDGVVPAGTQIATAPVSGQNPLTFETEKRLIVSRSRLAYLYTHDPGADRYSDRQAVVTSIEKGESPVSFQPCLGSSLIPHRLYLSQDTVFQLNLRAKLTLHFNLDGLSDEIKGLFQTGLAWKIRSGEKDIRPVTASVTVDEPSNGIDVVLDDPQLNSITSTKVDGVYGHWIQMEATSALSRDQANLKIESVTVTSEASGIKPSLAFFDSATLDTNREFYPFGERPRTFDAFFLAVPEAFAKTGSTITLLPGYLQGVAGDSGVELTWEFWNGSAWETLGVMNNSGVVSGTVNDTYHFTDTTKAFTAAPGSASQIQFTCPSVTEVEVNAKKNYWLRVRITSGNYGSDAKLTLKTVHSDPPTLADWLFSGADFNPPIITGISASYSYSSGQAMTAARMENNFAYAAADPGTAFQPFAAAEEDQPSCYLGFDEPFSPTSASLYVSVQEAVLTTTPLVVWEYWDGARWKNLSVQDGSRSFTESGIVEFIGPADAAKRILFGAEACWLRARLERGDKSLIRLLGLYPNTVWAANTVSIANELLGSSTETPGESFTLSRYPVLDGLQIEVQEPERPGKEDLEILVGEEGKDAVSPVPQGDGESREAWVRWHRVDHFRFSDKKSRHYVLDWFSGRVQFGDGIRGMVPPAGTGNIRAKRYQAGGGAQGNVALNTVTVLKRAIPFVDKAYNVDAAGGGSDGETVNDVKVRGPQSIKNQDRAVTREDYEWLAREASFQVARARCLPAATKEDAGKVRLILVPRSDDPKPMPSQGLIRQVGTYISTRRRRIATVGDDDFVIMAPKYVEVSVCANIFPELPEEADVVRRRVKEKLTEFFHPLHGGPDSSGWGFGRDVFVSEVSKVIEDTDGVHHAEDVEIGSSFYESGLAAVSMPSDHDLTRLIYQVEIGDEFLVASGDHLIALNGIWEPDLAAPFLGNSSTKEFHNLRNAQTNCGIASIDPGDRRPFIRLSQPIRGGYDFCAWCFGRDLSGH